MTDDAARGARGPRLWSRQLPVMLPWFTLNDFTDYAKHAVSREDAAATVRRLERLLDEASIAPNAIVVNRGRDGLRALLEVCGRPGQREVVIPAYTDRSVYDTVVSTGMDPVLVDISPRDCNAPASAMGRAVGPRTAAVVATHLFGHPMDMPVLATTVGDVPIIEDVAHALGAELGGRSCGSFGAGAFSSFAPFKVVQAHGGGVVWSTDEATSRTLRERLRPSRNYRATPAPSKLVSHAALSALMRTPLYDLVTHPATRVALGTKRDPKAMYKRYIRPFLKRGADTAPRFSAYQAEVAMRQLDGVRERLARRRAVAAAVREASADICFSTRPIEGARSTELMLMVYAHDPERAVKRLYAEGVGALRSPMADLYALSGGGGDATNTRWVADHGVVLPLHGELRERHVNRLVDALRGMATEWIDVDHERLVQP